MEPIALDDVKVSLDGHDAPRHDVEQLAHEVDRCRDAEPEFHRKWGKREGRVY